MFEWLKDIWYELTPQRKPAQQSRSDAHGSARWAGYDFDDFGDYHSGVFFGCFQGPYWSDTGRQGVYSKPETHVLICAPTGAGKGTTVIIPTLLDYQHSVFCIDPKGENAAITMRKRRDAFKQDVYVLNPWGLHRRGCPS